MSATIGQHLKQARQGLGLSLEQASEATHIRLHYLQALEVDDYSVMPSAAQARGFLRNYASALGVDLEALVEQIQRSRLPEAPEVSGPLPQVDLPPVAPEPAPAARLPGTRPDRARWGLDAPFFRLKKRPPAPEAESKPEEAQKLPGPEGGQAPATGASAAGEPVPATQDAITVPVRRHRVQASAPAVPPTEAARGSGVLKRIASLLPSRKPKEQPEAAAEEAPAEAPAAETPDQTAAPPEEPGAESPQPIETAEEIFREIGWELRGRRELLSLTPEEVERHIHVKIPFIHALESGDFDQLPSAVQTRGMLANYAAFLDLDTDVLLLRFADSLQASHRARYPEMPGKSRQPLDVRPTLPPLRSFVAGDMIFGLAVVVMVVALVVWGLGRVFAVQAQPVSLPTAPSISDVLAGTAVPTLVSEVTLIPVADTPLTTAQPQGEEGTETPDPALEVPVADSNVAVALNVVASERTFMRVMVDGEEVFNGRVVPGTAYPYEATTSIQILTGNGAALRVTYNGRDQGLLGTFGEVVNYIYTANSVVTPVPAASPTASATPDLSPTPSATPTSTSTATPTPTATAAAAGG
jgi:cytoskeletal protein RodZ